MSYTRLFSEGKIGTMTLSSRIIMPAMATRMAEEDYTIGQRLISYHALRAKNGCAMNITEFTAVHPSSHFPYTPAIYDDSFISGIRALSDAVHAEKGRLCVQLWHTGRQATSASTGGYELIAPSAIALAPGWETPREMSVQEIEEMIGCFGDGALRAKQAGADAVEIHGAHGYLINQFYSAWSNQRTDQYGGSLENRARFAVEIVKDVRRKVGEEFPILFRITAEERIPTPLAVTPDEAVEIAQLVEDAGANAIHVSIGGYCAMWDMIPPINHEPGFNVHNAKRIKNAVKIPVIAVGRINHPALAEQVLTEGSADFIAVGRGQLADPAFVKKAREGRADEIEKCVGCNQGCIGRYGTSDYGPHLTCLRNPACGHEFLDDFQIKHAKKSKRVLIAGGGIAGLEAAHILSERGHSVILCEESDHCGGQYLTAGVPPHKKELADAVTQMLDRVKHDQVDIRLNTAVTKDVLKALYPDELIIATGGIPIIPEIPGVEHAVTAIDVLCKRCTVGKTVVILGGGLVGIETAEYLTSLGKDVTIVEALDKLVPKADVYQRHFINKYLQDNQPTVYLETKCTKIADSGVQLQTADGKIISLCADSILLAVGMRARQELIRLAQAYKIPFAVIGDANEPRLAIDAIKEAYLCALNV